MLLSTLSTCEIWCCLPPKNTTVVGRCRHQKFNYMISMTQFIVFEIWLHIQILLPKITHHTHFEKAHNAPQSKVIQPWNDPNMAAGGGFRLHPWQFLSCADAHPSHTYSCKSHTMWVRSCMTTTVIQSQHHLKISVMELLYRKNYSTESRPQLLILDSLLLKVFSITNLLRGKWVIW